MSALPVLGIDTSVDYCSVAIAGPGAAPLAEWRIWAPRGHSELLHQGIAAVFGELGWEPASGGHRLGGVGVTTGPGSFTGLRIGIAAAKGLALAWGLPVVGVSSLEAMATRATMAGGPVAAAIGTRSRECFAALFVAGKQGEPCQVGEVWAEPPAAARARLAALVPGTLRLCGSPWRGVETDPEAKSKADPDRDRLQLLTEDLDDPRAATVALMAWQSIARGEGRPPEAVVPVYVRRSGTA